MNGTWGKKIHWGRPRTISPLFTDTWAVQKREHIDFFPPSCGVILSNEMAWSLGLGGWSKRLAGESVSEWPSLSMTLIGHWSVTGSGSWGWVESHMHLFQHYIWMPCIEAEGWFQGNERLEFFWSERALVWEEGGHEWRGVEHKGIWSQWAWLCLYD